MSVDDDEAECPRCQGQGVYKRWHGVHSPERDCIYCDGSGVVTVERYMAYFDNREG